MRTKRLAWFCLFLITQLLNHSITRPAEAARVEERDGVKIVYLEGTPYELGRQHGELLRNEVRATVEQTLGYFRHYLKIPWVRTKLVNWWLMTAWRQSKPYIPRGYLEELRGLSEASGVPLKELYRLNAIPDRTYSCANFAAWGRVTANQRLIHLRNLDWNVRAGIQDHAAVFVVHPSGKHAFINVGWAGFTGVMTGMNDQGISVGQVGAETADATFAGLPIQFMMRRVLEESDNLSAAEATVTTARRTVGINYVIADAEAKDAIVLETTRHYVKRFRANDPAEQHVSYARPLADAVFRADAAVDPVIRERQLASHGNPKHPGLEDPSGSSAYDVRYLGQYAGLMANFGHLDAENAQAIARAIAPPSNIQSVIFAWPDLYVANAQGATPAARTAYHHLDIEELFSAGARPTTHDSR